VNCYVDTSVLLRYLLSGDEDFKRVKEFEKVGSSELLYIESSRVLHRYRLEVAITDNQQLEEAIIHLTTAALLAEQEEEPVVVFTSDEQMKTCAHAMGIHTV
jgi:predicted nucleic acid-binding protein